MSNAKVYLTRMIKMYHEVFLQLSEKAMCLVFYNETNIYVAFCAFFFFAVTEDESAVFLLWTELIF